MLTQGAVAARDGEPVASPVQAMAWGLGRVAGLEHPDRWGGLVDLPPAWDEKTADRLCAVLAGGGEDQVAIRGTGIVARRLTRAAPRRGPARDWAPAGTVLVTGATGAIGPDLARWAAGRGAARVVLASRSGPAADQVAARAAEVAGLGSPVAVLACDITERAALRALLPWLASSGPRLSAVLHAAVSGELEPLDATDAAGLSAGLAAKAAGAAVLDELTAGLDLDAFVLFSSIAGVWGSGIHGAYAAANAYLDALASQRRAGACGPRRSRGAYGTPGGSVSPARSRTGCGGRGCGSWTRPGRWPRWARCWPTTRRSSRSPTWTGPGSRRCTGRPGRGRCWMRSPRPPRRRLIRGSPPAASTPAGWPGGRRRSGSGWCWTWCAGRPRRCWGTGRRRRWSRAGRSGTWGSTR